jgi:hypothetical protein
MQGVRKQVAVREHHALGRAGRPTGVEQPRGCPGGQFVGEPRRLRAGEQRLVALV